MRSKNILRVSKQTDEAIKLIRAQISYRLLRGDSWADLLTWWRQRYPGETLDLLYEVRDEAEGAAGAAQRYRQYCEQNPKGRRDAKVWDVIGRNGK